mgnify:CR=1 FL=1
MAEPTTTSTAAAWAVAAGLFSAFLGAIGVSWPVLFWGAVGSIIGSGFAPKVGRRRAMVVFPAASLLSAKSALLSAAVAGSVGAMSGEPLAQAIAGGAGIFFHPITALIAHHLPALVSRWLGLPPPESRP